MRVSVVGSLMGDAWNKVPRVVSLSRSYEVKLLAGSYALPVWEWAQKHVKGADFEIESVTEDPDDHTHPYCPGKGHIALAAALKDLRRELNDPSIIDADTAYDHVLGMRREDWNLAAFRRLEFKDLDLRDGDHTVVHAYTRHSWKNIGNLLCQPYRFSLSVKSVGLEGEPTPPDCEVLNGRPFEEQTEAIASAAGVIGVLSAWTEFAGLLGKLQIIVSFTADIPQPNPRAIKLVCPRAEEIQRLITENKL